MKFLINIGLVLLFSSMVSAQRILIHSHNDYWRTQPFYLAYSQRVASIEVDIFATENAGELLVAHDKEELPGAPTIDDAYLQPLVNIFQQNAGRAWKDSDDLLILLVDIKSSYDPALYILIEKLKQYPEVFDPEVNPFSVRVVISGNRPSVNRFIYYPSMIQFDGDKTSYTPEQLEKISMISFNFRNFSRWNGRAPMPEEERERLLKVIADVHALGKPIRFWGAPDGPTAWEAFHTMGVDYINTDRPEECTIFFKNLKK